MGEALSLALRAAGQTAPNPVVGCVVLDRDGNVAGEGFHERAGGPHAEVFALRAAGERARGGTAYVTLEPCAHHGRTAPCEAALRAAGVARVVVGCPDPDPRVAGRGLDRLRKAGVQVSVGCLLEDCERANEAFLKDARERAAREAAEEARRG